MPGRTTKADEPASDIAMEDGAPASNQPEADAPEQDEAAEEDDEYVNDDDYVDDKQRVRILPGSTDTAASFEFLEEGHTLGNALRYIVMKNPDVEFCAYSIPHPSEDIMNIRIQTYDGTAVAALSKGLKDLQDLCDVIGTEFTRARDDFSANSMEA